MGPSLAEIPPIIALSIVAIITGMAMLVIFRYTSNQSGIQGAKARIKAHLLEIRLFKDEPRLMVAAQRQILGATLTYLRYTMVPIGIMVIPLILLLVELESFFGFAPLTSGVPAVVSVTFREHIPWRNMTVELRTPGEIVVETPSVRIESMRQASWRIRPMEEGVHDLAIHWNGKTYRKRVQVGERVTMINPFSVASPWYKRLLQPGTTSLPERTDLERIEVAYPFRSYHAFTWSLHWLIPFLGISLLSGFLLQGLFGVKL